MGSNIGGTGDEKQFFERFLKYMKGWIKKEIWEHALPFFSLLKKENNWKRERKEETQIMH